MFLHLSHELPVEEAGMQDLERTTLVLYSIHRLSQLKASANESFELT